MATQPILQGYTLPWPKEDGYSETYGQRAVSIETATGNLVFQRITTAAKRTFVLEFINISDADMATVRSAYDALLGTGGTNNYTNITGINYTVTPVDNNPPLDARAVNTPGGLRWTVTMRLREASTTA